ncbi:hypothetical protein SSS_03421 [Sarcoptes scabiei]|uniref:Uncharacterized protein n=1 Tax=Sarcoptes scabiei TaxID=52283 RepID=A0A131ZXF9_SARSC|nr:hypothetical protein SSS_03421 [Sarcoptes scabiei]KPM03496.1 hypothetical protein QR98_0019290 [Sarcoptes scabiei]
MSETRTTHIDEDNNDHQSNRSSKNRYIFLIYRMFVISFCLLLVLFFVVYISTFYKFSTSSDQLEEFFWNNWPNFLLQLVTFLTIIGAFLLVLFLAYLIRDRLRRSNDESIKFFHFDSKIFGEYFQEESSTRIIKEIRIPIDTNRDQPKPIQKAKINDVFNIDLEKKIYFHNDKQ